MDTQKAAFSAADNLGLASAASLDLWRAAPATPMVIVSGVPVPAHLNEALDAAERLIAASPVHHFAREPHPAFHPANALALINGDH